jgi:hypothetical protein
MIWRSIATASVDVTPSGHDRGDHLLLASHLLRLHIAWKVDDQLTGESEPGL